MSKFKAVADLGGVGFRGFKPPPPLGLASKKQKKQKQKTCIALIIDLGVGGGGVGGKAPPPFAKKLDPPLSLNDLTRVVFCYSIPLYKKSNF